MPLDLHLSSDTRALVDALRAVPLGGDIAYADLSGVIGRDVTKQARAALVSARRIALRDHGAAFEVQRGTGLRRLLADETARIGTAARRSIRRKATRSTASMRAVMDHTNGLDPDAAKRAYAEIAMLGLVAHLTTDTSLPAAQDTEDTPKPSARVAQAWLDHIGAVPAKDGKAGAA